jgi:hypothetical protein
MFVAAWCWDPKLIPAEKNIFIPEPRPLIPGEALCIQADDVVLGLRYLVRMRVVEIQDWSTPPLSDDEGAPFGVMTLPMTTLMIATTTGAILELMIGVTGLANTGLDPPGSPELETPLRILELDAFPPS